jgi:hypothetical protein
MTALTTREWKRLLLRSKPLPDESFMGFILRLSELNEYDTPTWITREARIGYVAKSCTAASHKSIDLSALAKMTGVDSGGLESLRYPVDKRFSSTSRRLFYDHSVPEHVIRPNRPKICPLCFTDSGYSRRIWELTPVTACPLHRCILLDECLNCTKSISWARREVCRCRCGFDFRETPPVQVDDSGLKVSQHIHLLCGLPTGLTESACNIDDSPLRNLKLQHFLSAVFLIASQFKGFIDTSGKRFSPLKNDDIHVILSRAVGVFDDWPSNYFLFLDWVRSQRGVTRASTGVRKDFGQYVTTLYEQLAAPPFNFLRDAFEEYLTTRWDGGRASLFSRLSETKLNKSRYITRQEAKKLLKIGNHGIEQLIANGKLKGIIRHHKSLRVFLIERNSVQDLRGDLDGAVYLRTLERKLGITRNRILELVNGRILNPLLSPPADAYGDWLFSGKEVKALLRNINERVNRSCSQGSRDAINFSSALKILTMSNIRIAQFVRAILDGELEPCAKSPGTGLTCFLFSKSQLADYASVRGQGRPRDEYCMSEVNKVLGVSYNVAYSLVRKGLLPSHNKPTKSSAETIVTKSDIEHFNSKYILPARMARELNTESGFLTQLLVGIGIQPIQCPRPDGKIQCVFKKRDLQAINLPELVSAAQAKSLMKQKQPPAYSFQKAAELLGIDEELMQELVENGIIKPHKNFLFKKAPYNELQFSGITISKYRRRRIARYMGLVSAQVAADMLGMSESNLFGTYVYKGRLKPVFPNRKQRPSYFRRKDVDALVELRKRTVSTLEAAVILGVNLTCIHKLKDSGMLRPVLGPDVNGFGLNLYLRDDVEKLRTEREVYKAKRISEGGTARFGRPAGPRRSPVQERVRPRISQLVMHWGVKPHGQRISGQRVHSQLVKEGYQVGINTVYVCLRELNRQARIGVAPTVG